MHLVALTFRLDFHDPLRGLPGALFSYPLPFTLQCQMRLIAPFVLSVLLAGQGMIYGCVLTKCPDVLYPKRPWP